MSEHRPGQRGETSRRLLRSGLLLTLLTAPTPRLLAQDKGALAAQAQTRSLARRVSAAVVAVSSRRREALRSPIGSAESSGFVIDGGLVVTTAAGLGRGPVTLIFSGRITAPGRILGRDPLSGFALIRIHDVPDLEKRLGWRLKSLPLGDSSRLRVGGFVFSLGDPFGSLSSDGAPSLSMGVVTRIGRLIAGSDRYRGAVIETDAAINEGAFGGPLVDRAGRVVGMLASSYSRRRWSGAAVPIDLFKSIRGLLERGQAPPPATMGVVLEDNNGRAERRGPRVLAVVADGPAARAGLARGDRLRSIDGVPVYDAEDLARELAAIPLGTAVEARILRRGSERSLNLLLEPGFRGRPGSAARLPRIVDPEEALGARLARAPDGSLVIEALIEKGAAARAGLAVGDRILAVEGALSTGLDALGAALASGETTRLTVERGGWEKDFEVEAGPRGASLGASLGSADAWGRRPLTAMNPAGPAGRAGLRAGDLVLELDGGAPLGPEALAGLLAKKRPGDRLRLLVLRAGWRREVQVVLGPRSQD